jgi:hypothetical protein
VVLPLAIPGIAAGSIFTFSLTLGDFIRWADQLRHDKIAQRQRKGEDRPGGNSGNSQRQDRLHLAAFYDPAGAGGAGAYSGLSAAGLGRSWRRPAGCGTIKSPSVSEKVKIDPAAIPGIASGRTT